jgi:hypothetical protein
MKFPSSSQGSSLGETVHARYPCSKLKLDNLFLHWLSLQETQQLVSPYMNRLFKEARALYVAVQCTNSLK